MMLKQDKYFAGGMAVGIGIYLLFWGAVFYTLVHFLSKVW